MDCGENKAYVMPLQYYTKVLHTSLRMINNPKSLVLSLHSLFGLLLRMNIFFRTKLPVY